MDWWQRNKDFATKVGIFLGVFLVCLIFKGCFFSTNPQAQINKIVGAKQAIKREKVPPPPTARRLDRRVGEVEEKVKEEASKVGEIRSGEALVRHLLGVVLQRIGQGDSAALEEYVALAKRSPSVCFSSLYDEVRTYYRRLSIREDVPIDEDLGFAAGEAQFSEDEVHRALHALALVTRAVETAIHEARVDAVERIAVKIGREKLVDESEAFIQRDYIVIGIKGSAKAFYTMASSFNDAARFVPIRSVSVSPKSRAGATVQVKKITATFELTAARFDLGSVDEEG